MDRLQLTDSNLHYANVRLESGRKCSVSLSDLAPCPLSEDVEEVQADLDVLILQPEQADDIPTEEVRSDLSSESLVI